MTTMLEGFLHLPWGNPLFLLTLVWIIVLIQMGFSSVTRRFPSLGGALCWVAVMVCPPLWIVIGLAWSLIEFVNGSSLHRASWIMLVVLGIGFLLSLAGGA